jgi:hypothetical protein
MTNYKKYIILNFHSNQLLMVNSPDINSKTPPKSNLFSINNTLTRNIKRINRKFKKVKNIVLINDINEKKEFNQINRSSQESKSSISGSKTSSFKLIDQNNTVQNEEGEKYQENGVFIKKFLIKCKNCLYQTRDERNDPKVFLNNIKFIQSDSLIGKLFDIKSLLSSSN